jgi:hypothetical protein
VQGRLTRQESGLGALVCALRLAGALLTTGGLFGACSLETGGTSEEQTGPDGTGGDNDPDEQVPGGSDDPDMENPDNSGDNDDESDGGSPGAGDAAISNNDTVGPCKQGRYEGMYECISKPSGIGIGGPTAQSVSGPVRFTLKQSSNEKDTFAFVDGEFLPSPSAFQTASANIDATLVCGKPFVGALIMGQLTSLFGLGSSTFGSSLRAGYDGRSSTFHDGTWTIRGDTNNAGCAGTWSARYVGP